jgi:hypothetical protein
MALVFDDVETVVFVGGRGSKAGDANAGGGASRSAWKDSQGLNKTLANVMGANGEPLSASGAWGGSGNACNVTNNGSGYCRISATGYGFFSNCKVGLIANVNFAATYADGRYRVIAVDGSNGDWIDILENHSSDTTCDVKVGGAFDNLQRALDNSNAGTYSVWIYTNKGETLAASIDCDVGEGSNSDNAWKRVIGIDDNGDELTEGSYVDYDGNGGAFNVFTIAINNLEFAHIHAKNATNYSGWGWSGVRYWTVFRECKSIGCRYGINGGWGGRTVSIAGGYYSSSYEAIRGDDVYGWDILGVEVEVTSSYAAIQLLGGTSIRNTVVNGCLITKNGNGCGVYTALGTTVVKNTTMYKVADGIEINEPDAGIVQYNNVIVVAAKATGKAIKRTSGSIVYSDYACLWATDGAPAASGRWGGVGKPTHAIEQNPVFKDAGGGDFSLQSNSPCIDAGRSALEGGFTTMGCWQATQTQQGGVGFMRQGRQANLARLQIIR